LQAGINNLPRTLKAVAMVSDVDRAKIYYDGNPCSFQFLRNILLQSIANAKEQLKELLMGFVPGDISRDDVGFSHLPFTEYFAFGAAHPTLYGDLSLFKYVMGNNMWKKHFYGKQRKTPKKKEARKFLNACREYEKKVLVIMHILFGCGSRATDYSKLTFMNGNVESEARTVSIYNKDYLHCTMANNKVSKLRGKSHAFSNLLPRKLVDEIVVSYWKYVRPLAAIFCTGLGNFKAIERWQR
jgi:hypothetical protein